MQVQQRPDEHVDPVAEPDQVIRDEESNSAQGDDGEQLEATTE
jgi:hypothetical protein